MVIASFSSSSEEIPTVAQFPGIGLATAVIAAVVIAPVVVSERPLSVTPVFKAPKAPLLQIIVPQNTE